MEKLIDTFRKNDFEEVRIQLQEYRGHNVVDIRVWSSVEGWETRPTRKGITLKMNLLSRLEKGVKKAVKEAESQEKELMKLT